MLHTTIPLPELRGKSLLIFDDGLTSKDGHWFEYDKAVAQLHSRLGVETTIVCHESFPFVDELTAAGATVLPRIKHSLWTGWMAGGGLGHELRVAARQAWHFRTVLEQVLGERAFDCVLHPTALAADFLTWCLLPRRTRDRAGRVVLSTWFPLGSYGGGGPPVFARKLAYWKWLAGGLRSEFDSGRFEFMTDSPRLAEEYGHLTGLKAKVICSPRTIEAMPQAKASGRPDKVTFGSIGAARLEKGIDLFQEAVGQMIAGNEDPDVRFVMQWNRPVKLEDGSDYPRHSSLLEHPSVEFLTRVLTSREYEAVVREIDCMVLPYRRHAYQSRSSGVAVEAACAGIPMIYTEDCWLSDFVAEQGAGIAVPDGDPVALAEAMRAMAADFPAYKARAVERAEIARHRNSPTSFARTLWALTP